MIWSFAVWRFCRDCCVFLLSLRVDKATCERNSVCGCLSPRVTVDWSAQVSCQNSSTCGGARRANLCVRSCCCDAASKGKLCISIMSSRCIHFDWKLALFNAPVLLKFGLEFACWRLKHVSDSFLKFFFLRFTRRYSIDFSSYGLELPISRPVASMFLVCVVVMISGDHVHSGKMLRPFVSFLSAQFLRNHYQG